MIEPTPRVLCHNLPCEDLFHTCHPLRYCLLFLWLSLPFPPDQPHTMTIERRTEALTYVWELLDESLRHCPIARLHLLLQFNWLAHYHWTPNSIFPMRLRSLSLDFIGAMKCSACPTGHGIITETVLNYLLDDKDYLMSVIKEISIKLCSEQSRTCVQKLRELITSHSSKIKLFSWFNTDHLPPRFRSVIMDLAHCPLKILEIPLSEVTIHLFLNGSEGSLCSSLRRLSLHADGKWFGILPPEEKLEVCEWVCQRRLEQLSLCNIVLPRYPNVSELSMTGATSQIIRESHWKSIIMIPTLRTLKVDSSIFSKTRITKESNGCLMCTELSTLSFEMADKETVRTQFGPYMFDQLLSSCTKLSTIVVSGELWGSKMRWPPSVETIDLNLDSREYHVREILGILGSLPSSLRKLTLPFPELAESPEDYLSFWDGLVTVQKTCPSIEVVHIEDYVMTDKVDCDGPDRLLDAQNIEGTVLWRGVSWEYVDRPYSYSSIDLKVRY